MSTPQSRIATPALERLELHRRCADRHPYGADDDRTRWPSPQAAVTPRVFVRLQRPTRDIATSGTSWSGR